MRRFVCGGWYGENFGRERMDIICNSCIPWSWEKGDLDKPNDHEMIEIDKKDYDDWVSKAGIVLFKGVPVDFNPNSVEEGNYENYVFIHLFQMVTIYADDEMESNYKFIESHRFSTFRETIRALHMYELPNSWNELDFEIGEQREGYPFFSPPLFKLRISNLKTPIEKEFEAKRYG